MVQLGSHGGEQTALNMTMAAEGNAQIVLRLRDHPNIPEKAYSFRVYQDHPVKDIRDMKVSKNDPIMVGDAFEISFAVLPANATNLSALQWQLSAPNVLSIDPGSGTRRRFTAARAGQCDVTIRIDQVSYVQRITVYPAAERLGGKTSSMCVKENDLNAQWNLSIEPAGSRGGHIVFTSLDRAVVEVDSSGRLSPRAPGRTEIVAELLDHRHQVKATRRLDIEIQPQFSNPDIVQFIGVSALIITAAFTLYGSEYGFVSGIAALLVFGISFFNSTSRSVKIGDVVLGCVTLFLLGILYGMF